MAAPRAMASAKSGLRASGSDSPAPRKPAFCDTVSTPPEMKTSPSPALIAWKAIRIVWVELAQNRLTVAPGRPSRPARTEMTRAMLLPALPLGSADPQ